MKWILVLITTLAMAAAVVAVGSMWSVKEQTVVSENASAAQPILALNDDVKCQFKLNDKAAFRLSSEVIAEGETDLFDATISWEVEAIANSAARIRAAFNNVTHTQALVMPEERADSIEGLPFFIEIGDNCAIQSTAFSEQWDDKMRMLVNTQLDNLAFEAPQSGVTLWKVNASDGLGNYTARYAVAERSPLMILRQKLNHESPGDIFDIHISMDNAEAFATWNESLPLWWQSIEGQEMVTIEIPDQPTVTMSQSFKMVRDDGQFAFVPALNPAETTANSSYKEADALTILTTKHQSFTEAYAAFSNAINQQSPDYYQGALEMAAWLQAHPEDVAVLVAEIYGTMDNNSRPTAFLALQLSATTEAHAALMSMVDDFSLSIADQARAASALADIGEPTQTTAERLLTRAGTDDMAGRVSLLGVATMMPRSDDIELRTVITDALNERLALATDISDEVLALDAIGNTRDAGFFEAVKEKLTSDSKATRRHAANALINVSAEQAKPVLLEQLSNETDSRVGAAIIGALNNAGTTTPDVVKVLEQRLTTAGDKERRAIVDLLGEQKTPEAKQLLAKQFKTESNVYIKQQIGKYMSAEDLQ